MHSNIELHSILLTVRNIPCSAPYFSPYAISMREDPGIFGIHTSVASPSLLQRLNSGASYMWPCTEGRSLLVLAPPKTTNHSSQIINCCNITLCWYVTSRSRTNESYFHEEKQMVLKIVHLFLYSLFPAAMDSYNYFLFIGLQIPPLTYELRRYTSLSRQNSIHVECILPLQRCMVAS